MKPSKITYFGSEAATTDKQKGILIRVVLAPYSVVLTLSALNGNHAFYTMSSDVPSQSNKNHPPYLLGTFI